MTKRSHQSVLGLGSNPSPREIRLAYLRASLKAHPDHGGSNAEMVAVNEAWEALGGCGSVDDGSVDVCTAEEDDMHPWETHQHSGSGSESYTGDDDFDIDEYYDYGDLDETGGMYKVQLDDGTEISLEEHEGSCGCGCEDRLLCEYMSSDADGDDSSSDENMSDDGS